MRKINSSDQGGDFRKAAEQIIRFFLIIARIDEARVGYSSDAHLRGLGGSDPGKSVLDDEAGICGYAEFHRRAQVDVGMWFTVFDFLAGNDGSESARTPSRSKITARNGCGMMGQGRSRLQDDKTTDNRTMGWQDHKKTDRWTTGAGS